MRVEQGSRACWLLASVQLGLANDLIEATDGSRRPDVVIRQPLLRLSYMRLQHVDLL
jgi:hypothetical protein